MGRRKKIWGLFFFFGFGGTAASLGRTKKIWGLSGFRVLSLVFRGLFWFWRHLGLLGKEGKTNLGAVRGEFLESQCHEHLLCKATINVTFQNLCLSAISMQACVPRRASVPALPSGEPAYDCWLTLFCF